MSQVTMCDFCGLTSRVAAEVHKLRTPRDAVPAGLSSVGGNEAVMDVCVGCVTELRDAFGAFITRRRGGTLEFDDASASAGEPSAEWDCTERAHRFVSGNAVPSGSCLECGETS